MARTEKGVPPDSRPVVIRKTTEGSNCNGTDESQGERNEGRERRGASGIPSLSSQQHLLVSTYNLLKRRIQALREKRTKKEEKERYEKLAEKMHHKRVERLKRKEKRNKLLNS